MGDKVQEIYRKNKTAYWLKAVGEKSVPTVGTNFMVSLIQQEAA